ncbi:MAG: hypothetical protein ABW003_02135 [Microvirga sp.]
MPKEPHDPNGNPPAFVDDTPFDISAILESLYRADYPEADLDYTLSISGKSKTVDLPGDQQIFTSPGGVATFTNGTGEKVTVNITGSFHTTTNRDGVTEWVSTGRSLLLDPEAGFVLVSGRFTWTADGDGNILETLSGRGQITPVIDLLI